MKGSLRARGPGVWELRVFLGQDAVTGKKQYRSVRFRGRKVDAETELARLVTEAASPFAQRRFATADVALAELIEVHLERHPGSITTLAGYRSILDVHIRPTIGRLKLREIDPMILDRFYDYLLTDKKLSTSRVHQAHAVIRGSLRLAVRWGWLTRNPAIDASPPTVRRSAMTVPTVDQVALALAEAERIDPGFGTFVRVAAATGARRGEVCGLLWRHVDLDRSRVSFEQSVVTTTREGVVVKDTKNHSKRVVVLDEVTIGALARHRAEIVEQAQFFGTALVDDAFVFSTEIDGSAPWRPDSVTHRWSALRTRIGLPTIRLHDLRHFQATMLLKAGVPVKNVSSRIGHRDAATTLNVYAHALEDADEASADLMGQVLPGSGAETISRPKTVDRRRI